jgi:hypothetical protein
LLVCAYNGDLATAGTGPDPIVGKVNLLGGGTQLPNVSYSDGAIVQMSDQPILLEDISDKFQKIKIYAVKFSVQYPGDSSKRYDEYLNTWYVCNSRSKK